MFKCKNCNSIDKFELMFSPDYKGKKRFSYSYNENNEIEMLVDGYTFVPDLMFMNQFAVCRYCVVHRSVTTHCRKCNGTHRNNNQ